MNLSNNDLIHIFFAITSLLLVSHFLGYIFQKYKQPQVIGEIFGGLFLGPSILKILFSDGYDYLFLSNQPTIITIGVIYNAGLLLLMFCSGLEMNSSFSKEEKRTSLFISISGFIFPVLLGIIALGFIRVEDHLGIAGNALSFKLICISAIAVTSIPVISRIFYDLGILNTSFARIVISSAVIQDIVLYVIISIALSISGQGSEYDFSLPVLLGIDKASTIGLFYNFFTTLFFFGLTLKFGSKLFESIDSLRLNLPRKRSPIASYIILIIMMSSFALFLGISPMLGAFVCGIMVKGMKEISTKSIEVIKDFSFAFFIPMYFAMVGLKLNLIHSFSFSFFLIFLIIACLIKIVSVYIGARVAGEAHSIALNLGIAMNARGGPGIMLASLAYEAKIINESFYTTLILLAVTTSLFAGSWLAKLVRSEKKLI